MKRRSFLAASPLVAAAPIMTLGSAKRQQQFFELTIYHTHVGTRKNRVASFYRDVALPAYERLGIGPVGVFTPLYGPNQPSLYVLVPYDSLGSLMETGRQLIQDELYLRQGSGFLDAPLGDTAYIRKERQLMMAFEGMPRLEVPVSNEGRLFELRIYESHSDKAGQKKIDMFNEGGEISIFRKTKLNPVFFGETLFGPLMPNLTYMLGFESMAERDAAWQRFIDDPEWHALRDQPIYKDTVSNITDFILQPTPFSQI